MAMLLNYPDADLRNHLPELKRVIQEDNSLPSTRMAELDRLIDKLAGDNGFASEARYVEIFDRGRGTSLHLFEHVHGDSRDRGPAMVDLLETYEQAGLYLKEGELPDYLPAFLQYASTQPAAKSKEILIEITHILEMIFSALLRRESPYASVLAALLNLAGEKAQPVQIPDEMDLDEDWTEPPVFGGCSTAGQASPSGRVGEQTINFINAPGGYATKASKEGAEL
jgi:nitrate reductase delta subunit